MARANQRSKQPGFSTRYAARIDSLEPARLAMLEFLQARDIGPATINRIEVVLEELMANVARHAGGAQTIAVTANIDGSGVVLSIEDDGEAFNPLDATEPEPFSTLESATVGGQGIPLIKRLSKHVHYDRADRCNRVTAIFAVD